MTEMSPNTEQSCRTGMWRPMPSPAPDGRGNREDVFPGLTRALPPATALCRESCAPVSSRLRREGVPATRPAGPPARGTAGPGPQKPSPGGCRCGSALWIAGMQSASIAGGFLCASHHRLRGGWPGVTPEVEPSHGGAHCSVDTAVPQGAKHKLPARFLGGLLTPCGRLEVVSFPVTDFSKRQHPLTYSRDKCSLHLEGPCFS